MATTATYEVPAIAKSGDRIKVTVTAEDGETASDTVYVGGFSILSVEPTTAMDGTTGYKYVRATFSNALKSLSEADIEIRDVKTEQLYSVEKVALSTDGYTADITIAGDAAVSGTTFLQPSTIYSCTIDADGAESTLEFQLPAVYSDMLVVSADMEKNKINVWGSVRKSSDSTMHNMTLNVGDAYEGNLGALVGHTVVVGIDADNNVTKLRVNDGEVAFGFVEAKDGDNDNKFTSAKDYFQTASGDKYYLSTDETSTTNYSIAVDANNAGNAWFVSSNNIAKGAKFEYAKMILNPNGTVSAAVLWPEFSGHIIATEADGSVAKETSNNSKDFKGYTIIENGSFDYLDPTEISDGDIIYYSDTTPKFAFIYNESVTGDLENVYEDKLDIDGTKYNFIVWVTTPAAGAIAKQARYYDVDNDEYKKVTEEWANTLDKTEPVTIFLDTKGDGVLVAGEVGETITHKKQYIITKSPKAYINGLSQMIDMSVSDGTEVTLHINAADITSMNGDAFGDVALTPTAAGVADLDGGRYEFNIEDHDGKQTSKVNGKAVKNSANGNDTTVPSTQFQQGGLVEVIYNDDETKVTGLNLVLGNAANEDPGTLPNVIPEIQMKKDKDVEFKGGLASIKTTNGSLNLTDSTKVYVLTGTRMPNGKRQNDGTNANPRAYTDAATYYKEATDNGVKLYDYSDFDKNTQVGTYQLFAIDNEANAAGVGETIEANASSGIYVNSLVRFVAEGTTAKVVVIDDRGWNNGPNGVAPEFGTVHAHGDVKGGQVFKTAETVTRVLGVAKSTEYQYNSGKDTEQLAEVTIITVDGSVTLDNIADEIDTFQTAKNHIVLAEVDATGKVTKLNEFTEETGAAAVEQVNFGRKNDSTSTDTLKVGSTAGEYSVKADTDCLVLKWSGSSYSESTIGDINRDTDYKAIKFYTSQLNGSDVKAKVIVAVKDPTNAGYVPTGVLAGATRTAVYGTALAPDTTTTVKDQYGADMPDVSFKLQGEAGTVTAASYVAGATQPGIALGADGHTIEVTTTPTTAVNAGYKFDVYALAGGATIATSSKIGTITVTVSAKALTAADVVNTASLTTARELAATNSFTLSDNATTGGEFTAADLDEVVVSYCNDTTASTPVWTAIANADTDTAGSGLLTGLAWSFGTGSTTIDESAGTNANGAIKVQVKARGNYSGSVTYTIKGTSGNGLVTNGVLTAD